MPRLTKDYQRKVGKPPGTLVHLGGKTSETIAIDLMDYTLDDFEERTIERIEEAFPYRDKDSITWINIDGVHDTELIKKVGNEFNIHPLTLEDIVSTKQRPKMEDHGHYIYTVVKMIYLDEDQDHIKIEQISLIMGDNYLISFQEEKGDVFDPIRKRIKAGKNLLRRSKSDFLAYSLIDIIVDNYFVILERLGERIDEIEAEVIEEPEEETLEDIQDLKRNLIFMRKSVWFLRETISRYERSESELLDASLNIYFRDVYDHTVQVVESVETFRDMLSGVLDIYLSSVSNKMNEVMKVLTIIATIFIPLTFVAGIYGMNFKNMPELTWQYGYLGVWILMVVLTIFMIRYFRKKDWL